jgi:hypothetical protein
VSGPDNLRSDDDRDAARDASLIRADALRQARAKLAAARRVVIEAERSSALIRAEAARHAEARRHEADEQAAQIVRDAELRAGALASNNDEPAAHMVADIAVAENRLRELAEGLRVLAASLESVSGDSQGSTMPGDRIRAERAGPTEGSAGRARRGGRHDEQSRGRPSRRTT